MNTENINEAIELLSESQNLYKKGIETLKAGKDPEIVEKEYAIKARKKLDKGMKILFG